MIPVRSGVCPLLADTGFLTCEVAQIIKLGTTDLTYLVDLDAVDGRRVDGEYSLNTHCSRHLADSETTIITVTADLDDHTAVELDTLLVTFHNTISYSYCITRLEFGELALITCSKCLLGNLD